MWDCGTEQAKSMGNFWHHHSVTQPQKSLWSSNFYYILTHFLFNTITHSTSKVLLFFPALVMTVWGQNILGMGVLVCRLGSAKCVTWLHNLACQFIAFAPQHTVEAHQALIFFDSLIYTCRYCTRNFSRSVSLGGSQSGRHKTFLTCDTTSYALPSPVSGHNMHGILILSING